MVSKTDKEKIVSLFKTEEQYNIELGLNLLSVVGCGRITISPLDLGWRLYFEVYDILIDNLFQPNFKQLLLNTFTTLHISGSSSLSKIVDVFGKELDGISRNKVLSIFPCNQHYITTIDFKPYNIFNKGFNNIVLTESAYTIYDKPITIPETDCVKMIYLPLSLNFNLSFDVKNTTIEKLHICNTNTYPMVINGELDLDNLVGLEELVLNKSLHEQLNLNSPIYKYNPSIVPNHFIPFHQIT